ncbi:doxx family protein [Cytophaga sp. FL35]|uniref:doxx family protein n=1 Tax=Cytophaga sp. FL35 TaxID=1904456 RepID=UPI001653C815|nr:doxx family protein [Cytophaga sp. FL35]MBC6999529.1 doxx family protein [Cytophaga sp. FL35]
MQLEKNKNRYLQISIGLVYLWFGALKFFSKLSPAEDLAIDTISQLTHFIIPMEMSIILLALWETGAGLCLLFNLFKKNTIRITAVHMILTFSPLIFFPQLIFDENLFSLTLLGQYIIKNIVILAALGVLWSEVREEEKNLFPETRKEKEEYSVFGLIKLFKLR